jgi:mannose-6-phosphate isomerase-like protein (cupin superfamily)
MMALSVRRTIAAAAAMMSLAGCSTASQPSPTPPPGLAVAPAVAVFTARDIETMAHWKQLAPRVKTLILASTSVSLVDLVAYERSSSIIDPYKDNFRYVVAGTGECDIAGTRVAVAPGYLVVAPMFVARSCKATKGTLTFFAASLSRGKNLAGMMDQGPPAGRIDVDSIGRSLPSATTSAVLADLYKGFYGEVIAAKIAHLEGRIEGSDQFVYIRGGTGELWLAGKRHTLAPGALFVVPAATDVIVRATGRPIDALIIRSNVALPGS